MQKLHVILVVSDFATSGLNADLCIEMNHFKFDERFAISGHMWACFRLHLSELVQKFAFHSNGLAGP